MTASVSSLRADLSVASIPRGYRRAGGVRVHPMAEPQLISERVVRLGTPWVNWYLVADESGVTIVDTALAGYRDQLEPGLGLLDRGIDDVRAIVLTHGDQDHIGVATVLGPERGTPTHLHPADDEIAKQGKQKPADGSRIAVARHA